MHKDKPTLSDRNNAIQFTKNQDEEYEKLLYQILEKGLHETNRIGHIIRLARLNRLSETRKISHVQNKTN